jgi:hypothetical protein
MKFVGTALKAFYAAAIAALSGLVTVLVGNTGLGDLTTGQDITIALAALVAFGGVYGLTNRST